MSVCECVVFTSALVVKVTATNKKKRKFWFHRSCPRGTQRPFIRPDELQILQTVSHCVSISYHPIEALHLQQHISSTLWNSENPDKTHSKVTPTFTFTPFLISEWIKQYKSVLCDNPNPVMEKFLQMISSDFYRSSFTRIYSDYLSINMNFDSCK